MRSVPFHRLGGLPLKRASTRPALRSASLALLAVGLIAIPMGCGGDKDGPSRDRVELGSDGRLMADPAPLTLKDVDSQPRNSPQQALYRMLFWAQWGNPTKTLASFDEDVLKVLDVSVLSTLGWLRPGLLKLQPRIVEVAPEGKTAFVGVEFLSKLSPRRRESFLFRKGRDGEWKILYDTLLDRGLAQYSLYSETGSATPKEEAGEATKKAESLARAYKTVVVEEEGAKALRSGRSRARG